MRHLDTTGDAVDSMEEVLEMLAADSAPLGESGFAVTSNMVMSIDGAYSRGGVSRGLSSEADHRIFLANRMLADVILVGAGTARAERYHRPTVHPAAVPIRRNRGQQPLPRLVIVSASLRIDDDSPLRDGEGPPPLIAHPQGVDLSGAPEGFELIELSTGSLDAGELVTVLAGFGTGRITCDGGPGLLGQLAGAGLIDEYLLTLSPQLVGGSATGLLGSAEVTPQRSGFTLHRVLRDGEHLMCSFRRAG
ncbi:MAG: dihydrofolate reductase family protein [Microthrixaceae bacterium]